MKIVIAVKQVPDPNAIRFDASGVFPATTPRVVNEYDLYALEAAVQLREAGTAEEAVVVSVGPATARDAVNRGLAMGADRGVLVQASDSDLTSLQVAGILAAEARAAGADVLLCGQESSDGGSGNVGPQAAALLGWPVVSNVVGLEWTGSAFRLEREVEDGRQIVEVAPPVVICVLTGLNEPRSPSLKGIMAARKKVVEEKTIGGYQLPEARVEWGRLYAEVRQTQGVVIEADDPESAAKQVVALLQEKKAI